MFKLTGLVWLSALATVLARGRVADRMSAQQSPHQHVKHAMPSPLLRRNADGTFATDRPADKPFVTKISEKASLTISADGPMDGVYTTVTVTWTDIPGTTPLDWLAFYSPADSPIRCGQTFALVAGC